MGRSPARSPPIPTRGAAPYTIMMPPPNVTGSLHMGHALTITLQDILIRYRRMQGRDVLWQPGTDHAGIATQMVVERVLDRKRPPPGPRPRKIPRARLAVEGESGGAITRQLRRLGASPDWARERFTMDEGLSAAVRKVFVPLTRRADLSGQAPGELGPETADRDLRSRGREPEMKGSLWYFRYPVEGGRRSSPSRRRGPRRCSAIPPSPCIPRTSATGISSASMSSCR